MSKEWIARKVDEYLEEGEPEPWTVDGPFVIETDDCYMLDEANARLLAAAPELFAACEAAAAHHQGFHSEVGRLIRAALAKARGSK